MESRVDSNITRQRGGANEVFDMTAASSHLDKSTPSAETSSRDTYALNQYIDHEDDDSVDDGDADNTDGQPYTDVEMQLMQAKGKLSSKAANTRSAHRVSLVWKILCCCCFLGCCYKDPKRRVHCCTTWCFHARQAAFDFLVSLLLFFFCAGAFIAYTVFIGRSTEEGAAFLRFVNVTYVQETFVGDATNGVSFQLRVWAVNLIVSRTATISLLAIAAFFAAVNLVRRVMMCPESRQWGTLILGILLLLCIAVAAVLVSYDQQESGEKLLQKTDVLAKQIDIYTDWMGLVRAQVPSNQTEPANAAPSTASTNSEADALRTAASDFVNTLLYKLPEGIRVYAFFVTIVVLSFINIFR